MFLGSLPHELLLLVCDHLNIADLNALARTCSSLASLFDPLLYQQAIKSGEYKYKFIFATVYGQISAVSKFLKAGVSMSAFDRCSFYFPYVVRNTKRDLSDARYDAVGHKLHPFLAASFFGHIDLIRILISEGNMDVNFEGINHGPDTALQVALQRYHPDIIKLLLEQGAKVEEIDEKRFTTMSPIVFAARWGNKTVLKLIFNELHIRSTKLKLHGSKKAEFVKNIKRQCEKACWEACELGESDAVDILLRRGGVDVNLCVGKERLLSWAAKNSRASTVQLLVKHGARMENERDCGIVSVMYWGHTCGEKEERRILSGIVIHLLRSGCNVANSGIYACAL